MRVFCANDSDYIAFHGKVGFGGSGNMEDAQLFDDHKASPAFGEMMPEGVEEFAELLDVRRSRVCFLPMSGLANASLVFAARGSRSFSRSFLLRGSRILTHSQVEATHQNSRSVFCLGRAGTTTLFDLGAGRSKLMMQMFCRFPNLKVNVSVFCLRDKIVCVGD